MRITNIKITEVYADNIKAAVRYAMFFITITVPIIMQSKVSEQR